MDLRRPIPRFHSCAVNKRHVAIHTLKRKQKEIPRGFKKTDGCIVLGTDALCSHKSVKYLYCSRHVIWRPKPPHNVPCKYTVDRGSIRAETPGQFPSWGAIPGVSPTQIPSDSRFGSAGQSQPEKSLQSWEFTCGLCDRMDRLTVPAKNREA